jgi:hypothetical protein
MTAALDRAVANALGLKSVHNCERWSRTMIEDDDDIQVYKKPWVGLTDEEVHEICNSYYYGDRELVKLIETKLKEKNNAL